MIPKATFLSTKETEAQRLLNIATFVVNRFWQVKGFYLLPHEIEDFTGREIFFPDLSYPKSFWDETKRLAKQDFQTMPLGTNPTLLASLTSLIPDSLPDKGLSTN